MSSAISAIDSFDIDHLHEHFVEPVTLRQGRYLAPAQPGFSSEMKTDSLARFAFSGGPGLAGSAPRPRRPARAGADLECAVSDISVTGCRLVA